MRFSDDVTYGGRWAGRLLLHLTGVPTDDKSNSEHQQSDEEDDSD